VRRLEAEARQGGQVVTPTEDTELEEALGVPLALRREEEVAGGRVAHLPQSLAPHEPAGAGGVELREDLGAAARGKEGAGQAVSAGACGLNGGSRESRGAQWRW
jgi:hypothetical protein